MQVLTSRFDLNDQRVWFGRAKLLADRIVLKGIGYHRRIMLDEIVEVRWAADELVIVLRDGDEIDLNIRSAALWKYELQARCGLSDATGGTFMPGGPATGRLPQGAPSVLPGETGVEDAEEHAVETAGEAGSGPDQESAATNGKRDEEVGDLGEAQTDLFLQRESTYRIRSPFADDRPGTGKRSSD